MVIVKEEDYQPTHTDLLWDKLKELEDALYKERQISKQLKRANSKQKNTIRRVVKERDKYRKELYPPKQQYVNVQKGKKKR